MNKFLNTVGEYYAYCDAQIDAGLEPSDWGTWFDREQELIQEDN